MILPDWYKGYFFTHEQDIYMDDRPIEFVYYAIKQRPFIKSIIDDNFEFCIKDPENNLRKVYNCVEGILLKF